MSKDNNLLLQSSDISKKFQAQTGSILSNTILAYFSILKLSFKIYNIMRMKLSCLSKWVTRYLKHFGGRMVSGHSLLDHQNEGYYTRIPYF